MRVSCFGLAALLLLSPLAWSDNNPRAPSDEPLPWEISCNVQDGRLVLDFGMSKHPTYVGVVTPDDRFVYLRYAPLDIDLLGPAYGQNPVILDPSRQKGVVIAEGRKLTTDVFHLPGTYQLHFRDSTTVEGSTLHRLTCSVDIGRSGNALAAKQVVIDDKAFGCGQDKTNITAMETSMAGCRATPLCGFYPCCTQYFPGQPCFCDYCCVANPPAASFTSTGP